MSVANERVCQEMGLQWMIVQRMIVQRDDDTNNDEGDVRRRYTKRL